ncbi:energy transducer TonB [Myxococcus stipitatus]|uniref:energy transducer TonB n=1 Tax=Myxococcus stipitatus TaxID=83455 RepID=UPI001F3EAB98|nr:energy transducer TonB [Myxococcus stipitatus]MCE9670162.1 energy transducer TonB [Myxococcus stipitatus]
MILSFEHLPSDGAMMTERTAQLPPAQLFRMGDLPVGTGMWARWGSALSVAVLLHAGVLVATLMLPSSAPAAPPEPEPDLVMLTFAPPPPAAGKGATQAKVERAARPARPRPTRPPAEVRAPVPTPVSPPEPEVVEPPEPPAVEETAPVADAAPVASEAGPAEQAMAGGVAGGSVSGTQGGIIGAQGGTGDALGLKQVLRPPAVLKQVTPDYPRRARNEGIQGLVLVRIIIGTDGEVEPQHTRVIRSIPALDEAAIAAVNRWRFSPAIGHHGRPVRVIVELPVQFSLK